MARDVFHMTVALPVDTPGDSPDAGYLLKPLTGIRISLYARGTTTLVPLYQRPTGATEGPTPESGATGGPNPFTTNVTGDVEFWADGPRELDVYIEDTQGPARIPPRTFGWNAMPAGAASLPPSLLAPDGSLTLAALGPEILRQLHQIGEVIDWWRPLATVPVPAGFVICDGRSVPAGSHDFPVAGAINVPDLRNRFIIGALPASADDQGSTVFKPQGGGAGQANTPGDAPGIAGTGGSNAAKNFGHGHGVPGVVHQHGVTTPDHFHAAGSLYAAEHAHGVAVNNAIGQPSGGQAAATGADPYSLARHAHVGVASANGNVPVGGNTAWSGVLSATSGSPNVSLDTATNSLTWTADPGTDMRPQFIGLLKLMKVRRS